MSFEAIVVEEHEAVEGRKTSTTDTERLDLTTKEVPELTLATSNDQAFDNSETTSVPGISAPDIDISHSAKEDGLLDENSTGSDLVYWSKRIVIIVGLIQKSINSSIFHHSSDII